jgi:HAD superfamily hydrolase (TIGR01509 family)
MDAVCFDMDGVLVDSEDYWVAYQREELLPEAVPDATVATEEITGISYVEQYALLEEDYDLALDAETWADRYEARASTVYGEQAEFTSGMRDLLVTLRERSVPTALVTSAPTSWFEIVLERWDLGGLFDATVGADELDGPGKPDPLIYEYAAECLGVDPSAMLVVEDSEHGIAAARAAGATVIGFQAGDEGTPQGGADDVAASTAELRDLVVEYLD